jgi:hypothetical protein
MIAHRPALLAGAEKFCSVERMPFLGSQNLIDSDSEAMH